MQLKPAVPQKNICHEKKISVIDVLTQPALKRAKKMNPPPLPVAPPAPKSLAVMAGWICVAIGFAQLVAMCTNQVQRGLILLLSSLASLAICAVIFFLAIFEAMFGGFGLGAQKARQEQIHFAARLPLLLAHP